MRRALKRYPPLLALLLVACTQAPVPAADTSEADAAAIRAGSESWLAAWNATDTAALAATYAEDAVEMAPDQLNRGREAIVRSMAEFFDQYTATQTSTVTEVSVQGDRAVAWGTWELHRTPKAGGAEETQSGKWLDVQERAADGTWKTWRWMWNQEGAEGSAGVVP